MKKKDYEKPTMQIVQLQHETQLLAGSGVESTREDYGDAQEDIWN